MRVDHATSGAVGIEVHVPVSTNKIVPVIVGLVISFRLAQEEVAIVNTVDRVAIRTVTKVVGMATVGIRTVVLRLMIARILDNPG